ncbi:hypothetical protein BDP27DRAFT_1363142 [Rhodocollybia butyracea]|uniref:Uncharacterized protein n=1 Tax=Rhodocollybia butyracea TaxID=206335 RepID=A0A9P5U865_9AGAR|nr:hypothetical protein BDP27DRAFT_1363142 [Rhodocollybia butyracea]
MVHHLFKESEAECKVGVRELRSWESYRIEKTLHDGGWFTIPASVSIAVSRPQLYGIYGVTGAGNCFTGGDDELNCPEGHSVYAVVEQGNVLVSHRFPAGIDERSGNCAGSSWMAVKPIDVEESVKVRYVVESPPCTLEPQPVWHCSHFDAIPDQW